MVTVVVYIFNWCEKSSVVAEPVKMKSTRRSDLDSLLDEALDDFEKQELEDKAREMTSSIDQSSNVMSNDSHAQRRAEAEKMKGLLDQMNDPRFGATLQTTLQSLSSTSEGVGSVDNLFQQLSQQYDTKIQSSILPINPNDDDAIALGDRQVAGTLQMLGAAQQGMEGFEVSKLEDAGETMMEDMMAQFESLGEKEDYNQVILSPCPSLSVCSLLISDLSHSPAWFLPLSRHGRSSTVS
jgi:hypothetical protein